MHQKLTLALSTAVSVASATPTMAEGLELGGSLTLVSQTAQRSETGATGDSQFTQRIDITAETAAGKLGPAEGTLFVHLRAGNEAAVANDAFATSNATSFDVSGAKLLQAWYQLNIPAGAAGRQVELTLGKIDPFAFFDGNALSDDETEGFLNLAFVHNPLLDAGGDVEPGVHGASPGVRLASVSDLKDGKLTASAGVFATGGNGEQFGETFKHSFSIAQVEYAGKAWRGLDGAYRLYGWNNRHLQHSGWGISIDQAVNGHVGVFARYGDRSKGSGDFDRAWTWGMQVNGAPWGRENDRLGVAYGVLNATAGSEKITELFYAGQLNDRLQIAPSLQRIDNASGTGMRRTVYGVRAKASF